MFQIVLSALISVSLAAPQSGPLTPLVGNLVQTPRGLAPIDLDGFSEDLDQDGFVDPVAPVAPVAPVFNAAPVVEVAQPVVNAAPVVEVAQVAQPVFNVAPIAFQPQAFAFQPQPQFAFQPQFFGQF
jgi:hypothetical protein